MFRRKRSVSHGPINPNPSPSAQTAAAQAFRASQAANANAKLSSSAAAAALRRHTPTPTSVENVQTRRTVQRQQSISSIGTSKGGSRRPGQDALLRRASSTGSMTKRTFREGSPGRDSPVIVGHFGPKEEVEPVPPLPPAYATAPHRRAVSLGPAGQRAVSPRGPAVGTRGEAVRQSSPVPNVPARSTENTSPRPSLGLQRRSSRSSINFSYPINARPNSPRQSSITNVPTDATSIRTLSPIEPFGIDFTPHVYVPKMEPVTEVTGQDKHAGSNRPANGDVRSTQQSSATKKDISKPKPKPKSKPADEGNINRSNSRSPALVAAAQAVQATIPKRRSSPTREDASGGEENICNCSSVRKEYRHVQKAPDVKSSQSEPAKEIPTVEREPDVRKREVSPANVSDSGTHAPSEKQNQRVVKRLTCSPANQHQNERPPSLSPTRSTRFSEHLEIAFPGDHLHEPPPRSKSPAKSALKPPTSSHNATPERPATRRVKTADPQSESDGTSVLSDEGSKLSWKRKAVKVSFEDETEVAGAAASSPPTSPDSIVPSSPQLKWNGSLRGRSSQADDLDEVLKPRPALPSFGSIRGRRPAAEGDEPVTIRPGHSRPSLADSVFGESFSSDFAVGGVLAASGKQATPNQPLPPDVTSVEGDGFDSASISESSSDEADPGEFVLSDHLRRTKFNDREEKPSNGVDRNDQKVGTKKTSSAVPVIAIQPATPMYEEHPQQSGPEREHIPGSFPGASNQQETVDTHTDEDDVESEDNRTVDDMDDTDSESGNSVYSDAAENLPDLEGDGFGSINAIVSGSPPQSPRIPPEVIEPATVPVPALKKKDFSSQRSADVYSHEDQSRDFSSPPAARELAPKTVDDGNDDPPQAASRPARQRSTKMNGTPKFSSNNAKTPSASAASAAVKTSLRKSKSPETPMASTTLRTKTASPASTSNVRSATQLPTLPESVSYNNIARQSPRRTISNGSDSSSSFKRERRRRPSTGSFNLRRTMRTDVGYSRTEFHEERHSAGSNLHQNRPFSSDGHMTLRTTLRGSSSVSRSKSPMSTFSGMKGLQSKHALGSVRELDSSSRFRSRFADSSDDDEYDERKLTPVRGIPRRKDEIDGDSTALEDSSDDGAERKSVRKLRHKRPNSKRGDAPALAAAAAERTSNKIISDADRPTSSHSKSKRGVLGRMSFSRRHHDDEAKVRKSTMESAPRRDTPLERPQLELDQVRNTERYLSELNRLGTVTNITAGSTPAPTPPTKNKWSRLSSRSQKSPNKLTRHPKTVGSISWPLPLQEEAILPVPPLSSNFSDNGKNGYDPSVVSSNAGASRPHTSDGINLQKSQNAPDGVLSDVDSNWTSRFLSRRHHRRGTDSTVNGGDSCDSSQVETPKDGKKKSRFPMLRKAFGLS